MSVQHYYRVASVLHYVVQDTATNCPVGSAVERPVVNHEVVGSSLDYRDFFSVSKFFRQYIQFSKTSSITMIHSTQTTLTSDTR